LKEIMANRGREGKGDMMHVLVSEYAVTFRAVGTESDWPVNGVSPGTAQVPIPIRERAIDMQTTNGLQMRITDGAVFCGKAAVRHGGVTVGTISNTSISVRIDSTPLDLLVIERHIGASAIVEQGHTPRLNSAKEGRVSALAKAAAVLGPFGISAEDLVQLMEKALTNAEPKVRSSLAS